MVMSKQTAEAVRGALKAAGFGRADVSVRNESYSMGSTVHVTVRRADIALDVIEELATAHERIDRDEQGEILSGGNTFVHVGYAHGLLDAATATIRAMWDAGERSFGPLHVTEGGARYDLDVWESSEQGGHVASLYAENAAEGLTRILAARGLLTAVLADAAAAPSNDVTSAPDAAAPPVAAPATAEACAPPPAPAAAPAVRAAAAALLTARKALIVSQLQHVLAQLGSFAGDENDLARVSQALDALPYFGDV